MQEVNRFSLNNKIKDWCKEQKEKQQLWLITYKGSKNANTEKPKQPKYHKDMTNIV